MSRRRMYMLIELLLFLFLMQQTTSQGWTTNMNDDEGSKEFLIGFVEPAELPSGFLPGGYKFKLLNFPANTRDQASLAVRSLVSKGARAIVGPYRSIVTLTAAQTTSILKTPLITPLAASTELNEIESYPYVITQSLNYAQSAIDITKTLMYYNIKHVSIISSKDYSVLAKATFEELIKEDIAVLSLYYATSANYDLVIQLTRKTGTRVILLLLPSTESIPFLTRAQIAEFYGYPYIYFFPLFRLEATLTTEEGRINEGAIGISYDPIPDASAPMAKVFLSATASLKERFIADTFTWDSVYTVAYAIRDMLLKGVPISRIRNKSLLNQLVGVEFQGASGYIRFNKNRKREHNHVIIVNAVKDSKSTSGLMAIPILKFEGDTLVPVQDPIFPDGSRHLYDTTPKKPVEYYDCIAKEMRVDNLGLTKYSTEKISPEFFCDDMYHCSNLSDEDTRCDPSLYVTQTIFMSLAGAALLASFGLYLGVLYHRKRSRIRHLNLRWISALWFFCTCGIVSIFGFWGLQDDLNCAWRVWIPTLSGGFMVCTLCLKILWWQKSVNRVPFNASPSRKPNSKSSDDTPNNSFAGSDGSISGGSGPDGYRIYILNKGWQKKRTILVSTIFVATVICCNLIVLCILTFMNYGGYICGGSEPRIWIVVLLGINGIPLLIGCGMCWGLRHQYIKYQNHQLVVLSLYHCLGVGIFMSSILFGIYDLNLVREIVIMGMILIIFFNSFALVVVPVLLQLVRSRRVVLYLGDGSEG